MGFKKGIIMTLEDEIRLLKEKVALLERVKELRDLMEKAIPLKEYIPYPVYPANPPPYPWNPIFTWTSTDANVGCTYTTSGT